MASTSSSSARYEVFLSFSGETRYTFTDHLYQSLVREGFRTFRDDDEIERGQQVKPEIDRAILESRASIVVFSEKYATSRWCLDELLMIVDQKRQDSSYFVLPVFYHVDPSDIRNQRNKFAIEAKEGSLKWTNVKVNQWKEALTEVADMSGMVLVPERSEANFIADVIDRVHRKLDLKHLRTPAYSTGMDARAEYINSWLRTEQSSAEVLAIYGMGGGGKTTLAQFIYNSNKHNFESSSFLLEIGKHHKQPDGLVGLQKQLLTDILVGKNLTQFNSFEGTHEIEKALQIKPALIVLDNIDDPEELDALLGAKTFHTKSRIIITTRHLEIRGWSRSISCKCQLHRLELMNDLESLELLSFHAFGSKVPVEDLKDLAVQVTKYCEGNPLALKVLGSSLSVIDEDAQERKKIRENWISALNSLNSLEGDLDKRIITILQKSYDSLPCESHKELFLHIVFFFVGEYEDTVITILEHDWHARAGIMTLKNRCLLTVSPCNKLMMHQLLQEMGRNIVRKESQDPTKRSRVLHDQSYHVLKKGEGSQTIEGLALDMLELELERAEVSQAFETNLFAKLDKLKLLQLRRVELTGSYKNFPELRWLCWHGCRLKMIPSGLLMSSLVAIDMRHASLNEFELPTVLNLLKILNLQGCGSLITIRNLNRMPNLETLILWGCTSLTHVCKTIVGLKSLALLDLTKCRKLLKVSSNKNNSDQLRNVLAFITHGGIPQEPLFFLPPALKFLFLNKLNLEELDDIPVIFSGQPFCYINLGSNLFEFLPNNIDLKMLRVLDLTNCYHLKSLLCLPNTLEKLYTYSCKSLEKITFQSARFRLQEFGYEGCSKLCEIQGLFKLVFIYETDEAVLGHLKWIKAYQNHKVKLVGDEITKGRRQDIQVLYEYGIMSTYLWDIEDDSMNSEYISESPFLSFHVPLCPNKRTLQGLNVSSSYTSSVKDQDKCVLFAKISNKTKGLTWIYSPVVYGKPRIGKDTAWFSYWPIGNILDSGDEVDVSIIVGNDLIVSGCGVNLVYIDCELEMEKTLEKNARGEEVIGGDLSEFELTRGVYYLCRHDFLKSTSPHWLEMLFGDTVHYTKLQGWKKYRQSQHSKESFRELKTYRDAGIKKLVPMVNICCHKEKKKVLETLTTLDGFDSVALDGLGKPTIFGDYPERLMSSLRYLFMHLFHTRFYSLDLDRILYLFLAYKRYFEVVFYMYSVYYIYTILFC